MEEEDVEKGKKKIELKEEKKKKRIDEKECL
jgi:hypothetical protein